MLAARDATHFFTVALLDHIMAILTNLKTNFTCF